MGLYQLFPYTHKFFPSDLSKGHAATVDAHADAHPRLRGSKRCKRGGFRAGRLRSSSVENIKPKKTHRKMEVLRGKP